LSSHDDKDKEFRKPEYGKLILTGKWERNMRRKQEK
jgi:hypothetical protein